MPKHRKMLSAAISLSVALLSSACSFPSSSDESGSSQETFSENSSSINTDSTSVNGIVIPVEFNNDDKFLQNILGKKASSAIECAITWFRGIANDNSVDGAIKLKDFIFAGNDLPYPYYCLADRFPQTVEEMQKYLEQFFTSEVTAQYMKNVSRGTMTENADGTFTVEMIAGENPTRFIEIDGKMYCSDSTSGSGLTDCYWNTAKVTSRTDDTVVFTYIYAYYGELTEGEGKLIKEDGDWKFAYCECWLTN